MPRRPERPILNDANEEQISWCMTRLSALPAARHRLHTPTAVVSSLICKAQCSVLQSEPVRFAVPRRTNDHGVPIHRIIHGIRLCVLTLCVLLTSACGGDAAEHRFEDYHQRLARSLKLDTVEREETAEPARRPRKRELMLEQAEVKISMIEFLRLYDCAVHEVIGERNSVLGKVAPASQRLFGDLAFLQLAPDCVEHLRAASHQYLANTLEEAIAAKRANLPIAIANATLASEEFAGLWQLPMSLGEFPADGGRALIDELAYIESQVARWLAGDPEHDPVRFEKALGAIRHGQAGALLMAAALTRSRLDAANQLIQLRRQARPLCFNGKPSNQGRILHRVITEFFIGEIQVWLARVNALRYDLMRPFLALETQLHSVQTAAYRDWRSRRDSQLDWLSSASRDHVAAVRPILVSCGLAPGL